MKMILLATRILCFSVALSYSLTPSLCSTGKLTVRGRDFIQDAKGHLVLAVFSPVQCQQCFKIFRELNLLASRTRELRVVVFSPAYESTANIERVQKEFNYLIFERDIDDRTWLDYQANRHDLILFDRCGRLSQRLYHPRADLTAYQDTQEAIHRNLREEICGPCKYPFEEVKSREQRSRMGITAYVESRPRTSEQQNQNHQRQIEEQRRREFYARQREDDARRNQNQNQNRNEIRRDHLTPNSNGQHYQQPTHSDTKQVPEYRNTARQNLEQPPRKQEPISYYASSNQGQHVRNQPDYSTQRNVNNAAPMNTVSYNEIRQQQISSQTTTQRPWGRSEEKAGYSIPTVSSVRNTQNSEFIHPTRSSLLPTTEKVSPSSDTDMDYSEYYNDVEPGDLIVQTTAQSLETQIPKPFQPENWPTPLPQNSVNKPQFHGSNQNLRNYQVSEPFGPIISEGNIPCTAYTDDICYEQQERQGTVGLSKCCKKGVYLTDVCIPGKCSNTTVQLCCLQKFLQAKFMCCEDPMQGEGTNSTNSFSRCCYEHFVDYDECCPKSAASNYWKSVYDVCYPNTKVDYSSVKMEVHFSEGVRVIDLSAHKQWDFECQYGGKRIQYAYLPEANKDNQSN